MTLKRTGTNKVLASEDLPDLPHLWVKKLRKSIEDVASKIQKKKKEISKEDLAKVKEAFRVFFNEHIRFIPQFMKAPSQQKQSYTTIENLFDREAYLMTIRETQDFRYLELFTKMTYFTRFVERLSYPQTQEDKLLEKTFFLSMQKPQKPNDGEGMEHDCSVFFDIMC